MSMKLTIDAPDGLQVMFIGYVASDYMGQLFAAQKCVQDDEMHGEKDIVLARGLKGNGDA